MKSWKVALVLAVISLLLAFALAAAQEPVRDFTQLNTRLKPGDKVWVTDAQGREVKGKIQALAPDALTLRGEGARTFAGARRAPHPPAPAGRDLERRAHRPGRRRRRRSDRLPRHLRGG